MTTIIKTRHIKIPFLQYLPIVLVPLLLYTCTTGCRAGTYEQTKAIHDTLLNSSRYIPFERPVKDQEEILYIFALFELVSIVEINDVIQSFNCNGFLGLNWRDELLRWNASDYGGSDAITPKVDSVFRPLMVLLNTLGDRDLFKDDHAPLTVYSDGRVEWSPGSIFPASCKLDLTKFPFDEQHCEIHMALMNYHTYEVEFIIEDPKAGLAFFTKNGQWDITNSSLTTTPINVRGGVIPTIKVSFDLKRKPTFLVIRILLPTVFLSLLNLLVFVIPVESGEKISYGITVLLALTVFMSIMSAMLPTSSESMPLVIYYIFILLTISVLTVVDSVIIARVHHMEEREDKSLKAKGYFKTAVPKISILRTAVTPLAEVRSSSAELYQRPPLKDAGLGGDRRRSKSPSWPSRVSREELTSVNRYRLIGKYIDMVSLIVFGLIWVSVSISFITAIVT